MAKWEPHYTGIETWNPRGDGMGWYVNRNRNTKRLQFIRWACRGVNLCAFLGYTNYLKDVGCWGLELSFDIRYLPSLRLGVALPEGWNPLWWKLNPNSKVPTRRWFSSRRNQWNAVAFRFGWLAVGFNLPKFLSRWLDARENRRFMAAEEAYYNSLTPEQRAYFDGEYEYMDEEASKEEM